jgi:hypothetical protein
MRLVKIIVVSSIAFIGFAAHADSPPATIQPDKGVSLLKTLSQWKYPGAMMPHGASMSDGGDPTTRSVKCQTVLTTTDPIEKVIYFYTKRIQSGTNADATQPKVAESVLSMDDSVGRPVTVHIFVINRANTSTTLVVSRAANEKETHIAWVHYIRFAKIAPKE